MRSSRRVAELWSDAAALMAASRSPWSRHHRPRCVRLQRRGQRIVVVMLELLGDPWRNHEANTERLTRKERDSHAQVCRLEKESCWTHMSTLRLHFQRPLGII